MEHVSSSFRDGGAIPVAFAFCAPDANPHCTLGANRNPHLAWSDVPAEAKITGLYSLNPAVKV